MFNRKLSILAAVASLSLLPVVASASTGRLAGMTLNGDYTADYTSIYAWPSSITGLGNLVYAEFGTTDSYNYGNTPSDMAMGAVLPNLWEGRYGVWALHLRQTTNGLGSGTAASSTRQGDPNSNNNQQFDLGWGKKMGKHAFGLQLSRSFNELKDETPGVTTAFKQDDAFADSSIAAGNLHRNILGIGAGIGVEMSEKLTVEGAVLWQTRTFESSQSGAGGFKNSDDGGANYLLALRAMHKCTPNVTVVPVAKYYAYDLSNKRDVTGGPSSSFKNTIKGWQLGAAGNWSIGSNDLFVLGATVGQNKLDETQNLYGLATGGLNPTLTATESMLPSAFMALETQVNGWLTLRFGANKGVMHTVKIDGSTGVGAGKASATRTLNDSPFDMAAGAGVKLGSLKFDVLLTDGFYNDPFATLLQGDNSNYGGPFSKVSATYNW